MAKALKDNCILLAADTSEMSSAMRSILTELGFEWFVHTNLSQDPELILKMNKVDMVVIAVTGTPEDVIEFASSIRNSQEARIKNLPIALITEGPLTTLDVPTNTSWFNVMSNFPVDQKELHTSITSALSGKQPSVVSKSYVGPDRRQPNSRPTHYFERRTNPRD